MSQANGFWGPHCESSTLVPFFQDKLPNFSHNWVNKCADFCEFLLRLCFGHLLAPVKDFIIEIGVDVSSVFVMSIHFGVVSVQRGKAEFCCEVTKQVLRESIRELVDKWKQTLVTCVLGVNPDSPSNIIDRIKSTLLGLRISLCKIAQNFKQRNRLLKRRKIVCVSNNFNQVMILKRSFEEPGKFGNTGIDCLVGVVVEIVGSEALLVD